MKVTVYENQKQLVFSDIFRLCCLIFAFWELSLNTLTRACFSPNNIKSIEKQNKQFYVKQEMYDSGVSVFVYE